MAIMEPSFTILEPFLPPSSEGLLPCFTISFSRLSTVSLQIVMVPSPKSLLGLAVLGLTIVGCLGQEPAKNLGKNASEAPENKLCFIVDPLKLKPELRDSGNPNVQCTQDGSISLATLPDLEFQGIRYSSIDFSRDNQSTPAGFSINRFTILSTSEGREEKLGFLKASMVLYESVCLGLRSIDLRKHLRRVRQSETVIAILNLQVHRLESDVSAVEAALANALKRCFECNVKDRYNIIALGSQSGVNVDKFLEKLSGLRCKSQRECSELINKGGSTASSRKDNAAQLAAAESPFANTDPKTFVTSNPALSGSSGLNFALLSTLKWSAVILSLYYFFL